jgi:hypothetical protein
MKQEKKAGAAAAPATADQGDIYARPITHHGGRKYLRTIRPAIPGSGEPIQIDVYCVINAFAVTCPATAHAIKKLLCAGQRGKGDELADLRGAMDALWRAYDDARSETQEGSDGQ